MSNFLFAIDANTEEVIVSESPKGTNTINFIERVYRKNNEQLYSAVELLTTISRSDDLDPAIFKAMDKVCQLMYGKYFENK